MEDRTISVRAILWDGGRLLVEWLASRGVCFPPGGRVQRGEMLEETLCRELAEEAGLELKDPGLYLGTILSRWKEGSAKHEVKNHYFLLECSGLRSSALTFETGREFRWIGLDSAEFRCLVPAALKSLLPAALAGVRDELWDRVDEEL